MVAWLQVRRSFRVLRLRISKYMPKQRKCPECDSVKIAGILYGMPVFDEQFDQDLKAGKVVLGGCLLSDESPEWHCSECDFEWSERHAKRS